MCLLGILHTWPGWVPTPGHPTQLDDQNVPSVTAGLFPRENGKNAERFFGHPCVTLKLENKCVAGDVAWWTSKAVKNVALQLLKTITKLWELDDIKNMWHSWRNHPPTQLAPYKNVIRIFVWKVKPDIISALFSINSRWGHMKKYFFCLNPEGSWVEPMAARRAFYNVI